MTMTTTTTREREKKGEVPLPPPHGSSHQKKKRLTRQTNTKYYDNKIITYYARYKISIWLYLSRQTRQTKTTLTYYAL